MTVANAGRLRYGRNVGIMGGGAVVRGVKGQRVGGNASGGDLSDEVEGVGVLGHRVQLRTRHCAFEHHGE